MARDVLPAASDSSKSWPVWPQIALQLESGGGCGYEIKKVLWGAYGINSCLRGVCNQSRSRSSLLHMTKHGHAWKSSPDRDTNSTQFTSHNKRRWPFRLLMEKKPNMFVFVKGACTFLWASSHAILYVVKKKKEKWKTCTLKLENRNCSLATGEQAKPKKKPKKTSVATAVWIIQNLIRTVAVSCWAAQSRERDAAATFTPCSASRQPGCCILPPFKEAHRRC